MVKTDTRQYRLEIVFNSKQAAMTYQKSLANIDKQQKGIINTSTRLQKENERTGIGQNYPLKWRR